MTSSDRAMSAPALAASRTATRGIALMSALVRAVRTRHPRIQLLRGAIFTFSAALFTIALGLLPIAEATTIAFVSPLIVSILAGPVLGERVGWSRWLARPRNAIADRARRKGRQVGGGARIRATTLRDKRPRTADRQPMDRRTS